jgi:signal transduction histidine kinase
MASFPLVFDDGQVFKEPPRRLPEYSLILEAIRIRETRLINRTEAETLNSPTAPELRLGSKKPSASILIAPMIMHDRVIGTVAVHSYQNNTYTPEHVAVLSGTASQIAVAIENARLYETSRARAEQLATLNEIGRSLSTLRDLQGVFENAYQLLSHVLQIDGFYIALYDASTKTVAYPFLIDEGEVMIEPAKPLIPGSQIEKTIFIQPTLLINRTAEEIKQQELQITADDPRMIGNRSKVTASALMARLQFGDKTIGIISAQSYKLNAYTQDDLDILSGAANQLAIAIENSRLYSELQKELSERKRAEAEVRELNIDLEARVHQRTAELETANQELASFTYTVSHDLRAPIRGIHGLSHILLEEFGGELSAEALNYLNRIQANARQMGRLIDELLSFTHLGRVPVHKITMDMDKLVQMVIKNLMTAETHSVEFVISPLPPAYGDDGLIQQVLTNLIGNALKFTSGTAQARVEIGSSQEKNETIYFIRDNGAGFEMAYAAKLFGVFERLHRQDEFEGTGVGLAIVKRIIDKHGGRIWAEGKINQGATFYFTLPPKKEKRK